MKARGVSSLDGSSYRQEAAAGSGSRAGSRPEAELAASAQRKYAVSSGRGLEAPSGSALAQQ